jgi:iron complex transport system ATP-binding protein
VLSVLHEVSMALQADEMLILQNGRLVHQGACADPRTHRALEQVFDQRIAVHTLDGQALALPRRAASTQAQASA